MSARLPLAALLVLVLVGGCGDTVISISSDGNIQVASARPAPISTAMASGSSSTAAPQACPPAGR